MPNITQAEFTVRKVNGNKIANLTGNAYVNGSQACGHRNCQCCKRVLNANTFVNCATTGWCYEAVQRNVATQLNCATQGVVYVITCAKCNIQYVGQTSTKLSTRMSEHVRKIVKNDTATYVIKHFNSAGHCVDRDFRVQIIEYVGNDRQRLLERELFWIKQLSTAYPFGLNCNIQHYGNVSDGVNPLHNTRQPYFCQPITPNTRRYRGRKGGRHRQRLNVEQIFAALETKLANVHDIYSFLCSLTKMEIRKVIGNLHSCNNKIIRLIAIAFAASILDPPKNLDNAKKVYIKCRFLNKGFDIISFGTIFKDRRLHQMIQGEPKFRPIVTFQLEPPVSRNIFNYSKELRILTLPILQNILNAPCACDNSIYKYQPAGHIITGDLNIIQNATLKNIMTQGTKYRLPQDVNWQEVKQEGVDVMEQFLQSMLRKNYRIQHIQQYRELFTYILQQRLAHAETRDNICTVQTTMPIRAIKELQQKYVFVPADKATNDYVITCKKYYLQVMCIDMGVDPRTGNVTGNDIYEHCHNQTVEQTIEFLKRLSNSYGIQVGQNNETLPMIFMTPKLHKNPYKFRTIAGATFAASKPLHLVALNILKKLDTYLQNLCRKIRMHTGLNYYWAINSSLTFINRVTDFRTNHRPESLYSGDFSNLFTSLPHEIIKMEMRDLIVKCFKAGGKHLMIVTKNSAFFADDNTFNNDVALTEPETIQLIYDAIEHSYVNFANITFRQKCGVPQGSNMSPACANLTLSFMEYKFMVNCKDVNLKNKLSHTTRYADDIISLNCTEFEHIAHHIYPDALELNKTNTTDTNCTYLDLDINIDNGQLFINCYNKTDQFNFEVKRYPTSTSNVPDNIATKVFYTEIIRYARNTDLLIKFRTHVMELIRRFLNNGHSMYVANTAFMDIMRKKPSLLDKFGLHDHHTRILFWQSSMP